MMDRHERQKHFDAAQVKLEARQKSDARHKMHEQQHAKRIRGRRHQTQQTEP